MQTTNHDDVFEFSPAGVEILHVIKNIQSSQQSWIQSWLKLLHVTSFLVYNSFEIQVNDVPYSCIEMPT